MNKLIYNYIKENRSRILDTWIQNMRNKADERLIKGVSTEVFESTSDEFVEMIISRLTEKEEEFLSLLTDFAEKVVRLGWPLVFVNEGLKEFEKIVYGGLVDQGLVNQDKLLEVVGDLDSFMTPMQNEVVNMYSQIWEKTVSLQKIALQELSAPLIPVLDRITVMPLVGTIDTERAKQIMENLLNGVVNHRSEVVLIDITGVPVVDTMVAHHIIQAAEAVRLVGAHCMLCGIRPEIAQTIVNLGINLNEITTKNSLQKGIEAALEITSRQIVEMEEVE
ncbi:STAS domain-containing protein [Peribacillus kribbensis]|uniref:STAS domain-containing protein n=1 Tax=Peribacillus kribbensis TaxID=356658 RepID=UPI00040201B2|nr:STAS domain-containing protein [Peribacillus kribbensis]